MPSKAHVISGGISSRPVKSGSSRPRRTGSPAASLPFLTSTSSFHCRSEPPCLILLPPIAPAPAFESEFHDYHAGERPASPENRAWQGPRHLCCRRRPRAASCHRSHLGLRRRDGRDHPDEGRRADANQRLVVQKT